VHPSAANSLKLSLAAKPVRCDSNAQKPSSARPIQPNANIEQPIAATDAKAAIDLTRRMTKPFVNNNCIVVDDWFSKMARTRRDGQCGRLWRGCTTTGVFARKNPHFLHAMSQSMRKLWRIYADKFVHPQPKRWRAARSDRGAVRSLVSLPKNKAFRGNNAFASWLRPQPQSGADRVHDVPRTRRTKNQLINSKCRALIR
jgi:hypothetical protein